VPVLIDGDLVVWDSLAIVEYVAERFPDRGAWPADAAARAIGTSGSKWPLPPAKVKSRRTACPFCRARHYTIPTWRS